MDIERDQELRCWHKIPDSDIHRTVLSDHPSQKHIKPLTGTSLLGNGDKIECACRWFRVKGKKLFMEDGEEGTVSCIWNRVTICAEPFKIVELIINLLKNENKIFNIQWI